MRVAFITSGYPPVSPGGAGRSSKLIVNSIRKQGIETDVFAVTGNKRSITNQDNQVYQLPGGDAYPIPKALAENVGTHTHLPNMSKYDIVHVYNVRHLPACVLRAESPVLATFNNYMWVNINPEQHLREGLPEYNLYTALRYARLRGWKGLTRLGVEIVGKPLAKQADHYTVQTEGMKKVVERSGYDARKMSVVGNILDNKFDVEPKNEKKIVFIGRFRDTKSPDRVIRAYSHLPPELKNEWSLEMYGDGPMKKDLKKLIKEVGLEGVSLEYCPYDALPEVYKSAGLLIHTSTYTEPFSRTWLEAMASGTPIICSRNPSSRSVLDGIAKFYDPFSDAALAQTIESTISNPQTLHTMSEAGQEKVKEYTTDRISKQYISIYESLRRI
ncbi:glycosyltransferase family 4 protein [Halalkalicoccus ordinarius]|uniref:glycosyltransferase family 4 protein n=1 Tax=Halalkalicoccus ordinarius TaxID=3116651 RepID=UPI00300E96FA